MLQILAHDFFPEQSRCCEQCASHFLHCELVDRQGFILLEINNPLTPIECCSLTGNSTGLLQRSIQANSGTFGNSLFRVLFIGNTIDKPDPFVSPNYKGIAKGEPVHVTMSDIELLTGFLVQVMKTCSLVYPGIIRDWEYKLSSFYKPGSAVFKLGT